MPWPLVAALLLVPVSIVVAAQSQIMKYTGLVNCIPGQLVWVNCNLCTCNRLGRPNEVCSRMWCQSVPNTPMIDVDAIFRDM